MRFLGDSGDTLVLENERGFKYILVGNDIFLHDFNEGYLEILADIDSLRLAVRQKFVLYSHEVGSTRSRRVSEDMILNKEVSFFLVDKDDRIYKMSETRILKAFPNRKQEIKAFIKENKTDFSNKNDLLKLFVYCRQ
jgi:hypothetical protein